MFDIPVWLWLQAFIQGITEFLPVSSTGHLGLGWATLEALGFSVPSPADQQLIDIALHVGTLFAVIGYFFGPILQVLGGGIALFMPRKERQDPRTPVFIRLVIASLPALLVGLLVSDFREAYKNDLALIAATTILFGILLWVADRFFWSTNKVRHMSLLGALFVGFFQCLALIPGVSRSGITITAGRFLGLEREEATRFSMLLSIPLILGAGAFGAWELYTSGVRLLTTQAVIAAVLAFLAALGAIHVLMELSRRATFVPFVIYRLCLGLLIYLLLIFDLLPSVSA